MRVNAFVFGALVLLIFLGTIAGAQAAGFWSTSGKVTASGQKVAPTGANADEIKGWMKLSEVSDAYKVTVADIVAAFELPADTPPSAQLKDLESDTFSVTKLRAWLAERKGP